MHGRPISWAIRPRGDFGRLSLNPAVHVDPIGTLLFPLIAITDRSAADRLGEAGAGGLPASAHRRAGTSR